MYFDSAALYAAFIEIIKYIEGINRIVWSSFERFRNVQP
jgi:hypothetical protein